MLRNKIILKSVLVLLFTLFQMNGFAQNKSFSWNDTTSKNDNIFMTWNATTPESEMKDDIKALAEKGITIKYANVKRNSKDEIVAIKVEYSDRKGNKGKLELENQNPINTIQFFKQGDEIGFGQPSNSNDGFGGNPFMNGLANGNDIMKQFNFGNGGNDSQSFSFSFPNGESFGKTKSQIRIQENGKKPLVIEDGEVIEGGDDYTKEEIEQIKKDHKFEFSDGDGNSSSMKEFDFRNQEGLENFKKQMEKLIPDQNNKNSEFDKTKEEMIKAKEEMIKAKEEMEKAKKELEKAKSTLKTQKT